MVAKVSIITNSTNLKEPAIMTDCSSQISFNFHPSKEIKAQFDGGRLTTDAGLVPLRSFEEQQSYYNRVSNLLNDNRQPEKIDHTQEEILRQRGLGIVAGYEDANDADDLRRDPAFVIFNDGDELEQDKGPSQPTTSRMENDVSAREVVKLNRWLLEDWIRRNKQDPPDELTLEIDTTDDPAHGNQQHTMYNHHYGHYIYHPLLVFDGESGDCICARLRGGGACAKARAQSHLNRIITRIKEAFPDRQIRIRLRADAGFMDPDLYTMLEEEMITWTINLARNTVLEEKTEELLTRVKQEYEDTKGKEKITRYTDFHYSASTWECKRRVCAKVECGPQGVNRRYVVTYMYGESPKEVFEFYEQRGESENFIKEIKNGFSGDRLSCTDFVANAFRLLEYVLAYNLVNDFRNQILAETKLEKADIHTLRSKLFKVAARIKVTVRNIWVHLSEAWPYRDHFRSVASNVIPRAG